MASTLSDYQRIQEPDQEKLNIFTCIYYYDNTKRHHCLEAPGNLIVAILSHCRSRLLGGGEDEDAWP